MKVPDDKIPSGNFPIILASASPRREVLLRQLGLNFQIIPPSLEDNNLPPTKSEINSPHLYAIRLAQRKTEQINNLNEGLIISADTIVVLGKNIFGKPRNRQQARQMLRCLSGNTHQVITAVVIWDIKSGTKLIDYDKSLVKIRELEDKEIEDYLDTDEPYDKAGAYGIQGIALKFVEKIEGSYSNVVGLPLEKMISLLTNFGIYVEPSTLIHC